MSGVIVGVGTMIREQQQSFHQKRCFVSWSALCESTCVRACGNIARNRAGVRVTISTQVQRAAWEWEEIKCEHSACMLYSALSPELVLTNYVFFAPLTNDHDHDDHDDHDDH